MVARFFGELLILITLISKKHLAFCLNTIYSHVAPTHQFTHTQNKNIQRSFALDAIDQIPFTGYKYRQILDFRKYESNLCLSARGDGNDRDGVILNLNEEMRHLAASGSYNAGFDCEKLLEEMWKLYKESLAAKIEAKEKKELDSKEIEYNEPKYYRRPDTTVYNKVMKAWAGSRRSDAGQKCEKLLREMWKIHDETKHESDIDAGLNQDFPVESTIKPDQFSYSTVITAWARSGGGVRAAKRAESFLEEMEELYLAGHTELMPTTFCVNAVLNAWSKSGGNGSALRTELILERMKDMYTNKGRYELAPNTISYNTVIAAHARSRERGSERKAERLLQEMSDLSTNKEKSELFACCKPDIVSYNTVIGAWARSKDPSAARRAEAILRQMERKYTSDESDVLPDGKTYTTVMNAWARSKETNAANRAQDVLERMKLAHKNGNESAKPTVLSYNTVVNAWAKSQSKDGGTKAIALLDEMELLHKDGDKTVKPDVYTYTSVIDALSKQGSQRSAEKAISILDMMEKSYIDTNDFSIKPNIRTYTSVINAISRSKVQPERAQKILDRLEELGNTKKDKNLHSDVVCFNAVINAWGWSNEADKAKRSFELYNRMIDLSASGQNRHAKPDIVTCNSLLNACAFIDSKDDEIRTEAIEIAVKVYELVHSNAPRYGTPNHITYGTMIMILGNLLPPGDLRDDLAKNTFWQCCKNGHLTGFMVAKIRKVVSNQVIKELFGDAAVSNAKNDEIKIDPKKLPDKWMQNGGGRKSRPSRKNKYDQVSKQL
mmetsp:Transcript_9332/g.13254  ORF Transcript_9332/g.13254 Transcript_9332/m.13254 type:complete len:778 (+) Transcript_9332:264-2597(+)